jgi:hypothetical protein
MSGDELLDEISDELTVEQQIEMTTRVPKEFEKKFLEEKLSELGRKAYDLHRSGRLQEEAEIRRRMEQIRQSLVKLSR